MLEKTADRDDRKMLAWIDRKVPTEARPERPRNKLIAGFLASGRSK